MGQDFAGLMRFTVRLSTERALKSLLNIFDIVKNIVKNSITIRNSTGVDHKEAFLTPQSAPLLH